MNNTRTKDAFIDSGAKHYFFHSRSRFLTYEIIKPEVVPYYSKISSFIGKGTFFLPIEGGIIQKAYHAADFTSNVLSNRLISEPYEICLLQHFCHPKDVSSSNVPPLVFQK